MAIKNGTGAADTLTGTASVDTIFGGAGDDIAFGGNGDDSAFGGTNNDTLYGGNGNDLLNGDDGDDLAYGGADLDRINGGNGNDRLFGEDGADTLDGGAGNDFLFGDIGNDRLFGGNDNDGLYGGDGNDYVDAGAGNDVAMLGYGTDTAVGGLGNDFIDGEDGNDSITGDGGVDLLYGGDGNDSLAGGDGNDSIYGGAGNDTLAGGEGDDQLAGGDGNDFLYGGNGYDSAIFGGSLQDAQIIYGSGTTITVISDEGRDILVSIENLSFHEANEAPVIAGGDNDTVCFNENDTDPVTTVSATDPDIGDDITYSIVGGDDNDFFSIDSDTGVLSFNSPPNFEDPQDEGGDNHYVVVVRAEDGDGASDLQTITIDVKDVNEAPVIDGGDNDTVSFAENDTDPVTTVSATDPDAGDSITYGLGSGGDNDFFTIDASTGELSFIDPPDFESPQDYGGDNTYVVIVTATDSSGLSDDQTITVEVTDVADTDNPPVIISGGGDNDTVGYDENDTDPVTTVAATDPDGGDSVTYSLDGGDDAGFFTIDGSSGVLSFIDPPDFEDPQDQGGDNSYVVIVKAEDSSGQFDEQTITVNVNDVNEVPVITSGDGDTDSVSYAENDTDPVTTVSATDPDAGDQVTYGLEGGGDNDFFTIDPSSGVLSFIDPPDFENPQDNGGDNTYVVLVSATDSSGLFDEQTITIGVTDAEEAPVVDSHNGDQSYSVTFAENGSGGVVTIHATDPDVADDVVYAIGSGGDNDLFSVDPESGELTFNDPPDFENPQDSGTDNFYEVVLSASDSTLSAQQTITIEVTDVNEVPVIGGGDNDTVFFAENDTDPVTTVSATDPDAGDQVTYSLDGGDDAGFFTIDASTGALSFIDPPDFEDPQDSGTDNSYVVVVKAEDGSGLFDEQTITVDVTDVSDSGDPDDHDDQTAANYGSDTPGAGNDLVRGSSGSDTSLYGDSRDDTIFGAAGNDSLDGDSGDDILYGGSGNDFIFGDSGNDLLYGGSGQDSVQGSSGVDRLYGGKDDDSVYGDASDDSLFGGAGTDTLYGDAGNDSLFGGAGSDSLYGGAGDDTFFVTTTTDAVDTIMVFTDGHDLINLDAIDAIASTGGNDDFIFDSGAASANPATGHLSYTTGGGNTTLWVDTGGGDVELIVLIGTNGTDFTLDNTDFNL